MSTIEHFETIIGPSMTKKTIQYLFLWGQLIVRNYIQYGELDVDMIITVIGSATLKIETNRVNNQYIDNIKEKSTQIKRTFESTLDLLPHGVIIFDKATQNFTLLNQTIKRYIFGESSTGFPHNYHQLEGNEAFIDKLKGYVIHEVESQSTDANSDYISDNSKKSSSNGREITFSNFWVYLQQASKYNGQDYIFKSNSPKTYIQVIAQGIKSNQQQIVFCTDITKLKRIEKKSQKIRSNFFSAVAHELRTPLNSIGPIVKLAISSLKKSNQQQDNTRIMHLLNIVLSSSVHLQSVIEDALDMSRIENSKFTLNFEEFDIRDLINEVESIMVFQTEQKGIAITYHVSQMVPKCIFSDQKRIKQVLFNLLGNAYKFTFKGGIEIRVEYYPTTQILETSIIDTGVGMSEKDLKKLFQFFGKLEKDKDINKNGMGLGLNISKMIIKQLGGNIEVKSKRGEGSQFTFRIPLSRKQESNENERYQLNLQTSEKRTSEKLHSNNSHENFVQREKSKNPPGKVFTQTQEVNQEESDFHSEHISLTTEENDCLNFHFASIQKVAVNSVSKQRLDFQNRQNSEKSLNKNNTRGKKWKVLIVDDSAYNLFVLEELLKEVDATLEVQTALNGQICLNKFDGQDIIFMDLQMPVLDGYQTVVRLNEKHQKGEISLKNTSIVALSAISESQFYQSLAYYKNCNFHSFMEKPVQFNLIKNKIEAIKHQRSLE
ncbi:hypothetical protein FGO68_gene3883 [Halteria grandinella]|uniref:Histidine kinase n=1 Tax=Halteria grandinella TaxID=5974 RepID=A0A8J8NYB1_HALGN|nr:hypothetical protein FGO68_gene3883 [Halteria grandinella]